MLIKHGEHAHLAQLLTFMELGEQLARDCAHQQTSLAPEPGMKTFLAGQSRQEGYHAVVFHGAIRWLAPKTVHTTPITDHMQNYRELISSAIARQDFAETLVAEQIILEGLGEAILKKIDVGLAKRGAPFTRLRRMLIHQEEAHYQFGLRILSNMIEKGEESLDSLRQKSKMYLPLAKTMLFSAEEAFTSIHEDPQEYWDEFCERVPSWLQTNARDQIPSPMYSVRRA